MTQGTCTVENCTAPILCRGVCGRHYQKLRRHGSVDGGYELKPPRPCMVEGCETRARARDMCAAHYTRLHHRGTLEPGKPRGRVVDLEAGTAECRRCWQVKPITDFSRHKQQKSGLHPNCKECRRIEGRRKYLVDRDAYRERARWGSVKYRFGITKADFEAMVAAQDGVCAICKKPEPDGRRLSIDHCHATGRIRGLLCNACNRMLGMALDDPQRLRSAAAYLEE